jgi:hypothetical protein
MNENTVFILHSIFLCFNAENKKKFCFSQKHLTAPVAHPAPQSVSTVSPLPRVPWQNRVSDHLFPHSAVNVIVCSNAATENPIYAMA